MQQSHSIFCGINQVMPSAKFGKFFFLLPFLCIFNNSCDKGNTNISSFSSFDNCAPLTDFVQLGNIFYNHLSDHMGFVSPGAYLPESIRDSAIAKYQDFRTATQGMTYSQTLDYSLASGAFALGVKSYLLLMHQKMQSAVTTYANPTSFIRDGADTLKIQVQEDATLSCIEKEELTAYFTIISTVCRYITDKWPEESTLTDAVQYRGCASFWGCFWDGFFSPLSALWAILGVNEIVFISSTAGNIAGTVLLVAILVIANAITEGDDCCQENCTSPKFVAVRYSDCSLSASYMAQGQGSSVNMLTWVPLSGGTISPTSTSSPYITTVTQSIPSVPVVTSISATCTGTSFTPPPFLITRDHAAEVIKVEEFLIFGKALVEDDETCHYHVGSTGDSRIEYEFSAQNGTVIYSAGHTALIHWDLSESNPHGKVIVTARNICQGGLTRVVSLDVNWWVDNYH